MTETLYETLYEWDCQSLLWVQEHLRSDFLTPIMKFFTYLANGGILPIAVCLLLLFLPKTKRVGSVCTTALAANALITNLILKNLIARVRPYERIPEVQNLVGVQQADSFPSGHAAACFCIAVVLFIRADKKISIPALIVATIISFSRIYVGVHYPSDVLAGIGMGVLIGCCTCLCFRRYEKKQLKKQ